MLGITTTNARVGGFRGGISAEAKTIYNRIIADGGVSNLTRLNFFVKGLKAIYGDLANVPVCYDAHWIGYKLGSGTGATAGQAAAKLYSLTVAGDAIQATAASQPLLLAHNGASSDNYWYGSGVTNNYVSTPNAAANQITGDIEIIGNFKLDSLATDQTIIAKDNISSRFYNLIYAGTDSGKIYFGRNIGGTWAYSISTVGASFTTSTIYWLKANRSASTGDVKFFTSTDGINYTQLGATVTSTAGALTTGNLKVNVGALSNDAANIIQGKIYRATIANSIGGTPVVDFNPATYNAATSQTQWTSATDEIWTINTGTATAGYKGVLVDRTIVQTDAVDDQLVSGAFTLNQPNTSYYVVREMALLAKSISDGITLNTREVVRYPSNSLGIFAGNLISAVNSLGVMKLITSLFNTTSSTLAVNNSNILTGNVGTTNSNGLRIANGADGFHNLLITSMIISLTADDSTKQTAMYNLLRGLNNNAF